MSGSLSIDCERCIVLSVLPYNDGRRVVRVLTESIGTVALWVSEGRGKNRQVGHWHPGAMLELTGLTRKGSEGLVRFKSARRKFIPVSTMQDVRKGAIVFFLCELIGKLFPEESEHMEVFRLFWNTLEQVDQEQQVAWVHVFFIGELIRLLGIAPEASPRRGEDVLNLQTGEWTSQMGPMEDHLPAPLSHWFIDVADGSRNPIACDAQNRKQLIQGQIRYLHHQMGGLREIKSYDVLEAVFN